MELEAEGMAELKRLVREVVAFRQQFGAGRQLKPFAMPVIDLVRPVRAHGVARRSGADRIVADLGDALRMRRDFRAKLHREHLRAEADAEERPLLAQGHVDPVDLAADVVVGIVGAHRPAEEHGAGMLVQRLRQRIAETRTADVEPVPERAQRIADAAGRRRLLMQDDQDRKQGVVSGSTAHVLRPGKGRTFSLVLVGRKVMVLASGNAQTEIVPKCSLNFR